MYTQQGLAYIRYDAMIYKADSSDARHCAAQRRMRSSHRGYQYGGEIFAAGFSICCHVDLTSSALLAVVICRGIV